MGEAIYSVAGMPVETWFAMSRDPTPQLAEIAPGNFSGHYLRTRGQKVWFLAAPLLESS
jgi:hypothetical protein